MSYVITRTCEWCGKTHDEYDHEIICRSGHDDDVKLADLCGDCYGPLRRALSNQRDIALDEIITFNQWLVSVLIAACLGAFITAVIMTSC